MSSTPMNSFQTTTLEKVAFRMSFVDLSKATDNFSEDNVIGVGRKGTMYKAKLQNGCLLAINRFHDSQHFEDQILAELMTLGRLRHKNLLPLLGFCFEMEERLLVYKYMPKGNLYDWLHSREGKTKIMQWPLRVKIVIGVARGLAWLHYNCNFGVVHQNITSKCILLDKSFEPKIYNFGEAKLVNLNDTASRSFIVDGNSVELDLVKKDVYSFGIVLLELVTGEEFSKVSDSSLRTSDGNLVERSAHLLNRSSGLYNVVDKSLMGKGFDDEILQFLGIACNCIQSSPDLRPTMLEVYKTMRATGEKYGLTDHSEIDIAN